MHKIHNRLFAVALALAMVFGMFPVQGAAAAQTEETQTVRFERIDIRTAEEFAGFAEKCYLDSWSEDKYVSLRADIDLTGTDIRVIPVFNGVFDGVGHTISGFDYLGDGYVVGLFRYVEGDGVIQNLTLKGDVASENQKECIGSICGVNYGTIKNCTFQGTVSGRDTVGGIAGINGDTGTITGCSVKGRISGYYSTGGIAGINHGTLNHCANRAGINDSSAWVEEDDEMGTGMGILESLTNNDDSELYSGVDTGGIAGFSDGVITKCTNAGTVGYEHTGYNIGGIAGRQSGIVSDSTNSGTVYGRKDIGGIVGQMEPFVEIDEAKSLRDAVNRLHDLIDKTIDDMQASKNGIKRDFDTLTSYSDGAVDAADALAEQMGGFVDDNLDQVQAVTDRLDRVMEMTPGVFDDFEAAENSFHNAVEALKEVSDDLGKITDVGNEPYDVSKNKRITLLHTVGGVIVSDSYNPRAGEEVQITAETEGSSNEYRLSRVDVVKVTNGEKVKSSAASSFTFTMPAENVRVEAYFEPDDGIAVTSLDDAAISLSEVESAAVSDTSEETDSECETETDSAPVTEEETDEESDTETTDAAEGSTESDGTAETGTKPNSTTETSTESDSTESAGVAEPPDTSEDTESQTVQAEERMLYGAVGDEDEEGDLSGYASPRQTSPVVKISSNLSGNAVCSVNDSKSRAAITAEPSGGYTVDYVSLNNSRISPDSGNSYSFSISDGAEYKVFIQFRKITTKSATVDNAKSEIEYAVREVQDAADKINSSNKISAEELQRMLSATSTIMENTEILADIYGKQASSALKAVNRDLGNTSDHLKSALDSLKSATRRTRDIVNYVNAQPDIRFSKLGAEYDFNRINLNNHLHAISESLKTMGDDASHYSDVVNADLRAVNDQINVIFDLLADRLSDAQKMEIEAFYSDAGDEDIDSITTGRAEACSNKGVVKGDINVGGIAGSMSIDDEDLDGSAVGSIEYELGRRFIMKCLVTNSVNEGYVTAKKDGAGGICGYMDRGVITDSESYGSVESTEGDYVGGICGESLTVIRGCYSLCFVAGNRNVGGIAGYADTLKNCYSMADVQSKNGKAGAIAGQISGYDKVRAGTEEAKVAGNYYVGEAVHGIDNISYIGVAEPITYDELLAVEQLPAQFGHLKVIYRIDDTYLGSEEVKYGARLDHLDYPQIPEKEGCYGVWPDVSNQKMGGIFVVEGEYKDNVTVVQSVADAAAADVTNAGQWARPYALVEDIFTEDTVLKAVVSDRTPPAEAAEKQYVVYEVTLENSGIGENASFALRIWNPYEDAAVYGYRDGAWTEVEGKARGQYLQVSMTGTQACFCIVENTSNLVFAIVGAAAAVSVVLLLAAVVRKGGARRKQKRRKNN